MALSIFILLCSHHHQSSSELFLSSPNETTYPLKNNYPFSPPHSFQQLLATTVLLSASDSLSISSYEWNHKVFLCDRYISLNIVSSRFIQGVRISFLGLNNIPLWVYTTFCLNIHPLMNTWVLLPFWLLWIMLQWTWVYKYLFESLLSVLLGMSWSRTAESYGNL